MKFLEAVASRFALREDLRELCFVFPNRRSALFFQRYLGRAAGKPVFSPSLKTIDELFEELSGLKAADKIEALYLLYKDYIAVKPPLREGEEQETFDDFVFWGDIIIRDFDDLDKYLVRADKLLLNIKQLRDLSIDYGFLSDDQKRAIADFCRGFDPDRESPDLQDKKHLFNETWNLLLPLYDKFRETLKERGKGYPGMIYRSVTENGNIGGLLKQKYKEIIFVGLNALNECEKILLDTTLREGIGDFYWDFCGRMVTDLRNRSSRFVGENVRRYPSKNVLELDDSVENQTIEVIKVPSSVGQTRVAGQLLANLQKEGLLGNPVETAVVLPDESLLAPMLGDIPQYIESVNVTMGYPLSSSAVASFFAAVEKLQMNGVVRGGKPCFYHRDVVEVLEHPFFKAADADGCGTEIKRQVVRESRVFVEEKFLSSFGELFQKVFRYVGDTPSIPSYLLDLIRYIQQYQEDIVKEFLCGYDRIIARLNKTLTDISEMQPVTWWRLLSKCSALISIPYRGEPLNGLQIMGPLETRAIDFRNVIMLSVSEGSFPSKSVSASFIPYNLRLGFGMPTYEYQDSIWAYHFYRSICRAERVFLIYDSRSEGMQSGEESRYIKQLKYIYGVDIKERTASYRIESGDDGDGVVKVEKDAGVLEALEKKFISGKGVLSASSLNCYIDCPLKFHYQFVLGIQEEQDVVEELDSQLFGTVFHSVMEHLYSPFRGSTLTTEDIAKMRSDKAMIERLTDEAFANEASIREITGRNIISKQLILKFVDRVLEVDAGMTPFTLVGTESSVSKDFELKDGRKVRLYGKIDRLDSTPGCGVRVVDYKTGRVDGRDECGNVERLFDSTLSNRPNIAFQLYFYSLLSGKNLQCAYPVKTIFTELPRTHVIDEENADLFREKLADLVEEIFNPAIPFSGRGDDKACKYCNFKRLCRKQ